MARTFAPKSTTPTMSTWSSTMRDLLGGQRDGEAAEQEQTDRIGQLQDEAESRREGGWGRPR